MVMVTVLEDVGFEGPSHGGEEAEECACSEPEGGRLDTSKGERDVGRRIQCYQ